MISSFTTVITAALLGMVAVIAGAFGAHGLKALIAADQLAVWHTAVEYNFYHVFALLFLATIVKGKNKWATASYFLFTIGVLFFSGSLYLLACRDLLHLSPKVIGRITRHLNAHDYVVNYGGHESDSVALRKDFIIA